MAKTNQITFVEAAHRILSSSKGPMSPKAIADVILERGLIRTKSKRPDATLSARLRTDKRFVKKGKGLWTVR